MERAVALNYFFGGALCALCFTNACTVSPNQSSQSSNNPFDAYAHEGDDPVPVILVGWEIAENNPVPVQICDGQNGTGLCAQVGRNGLGNDVLATD